MDRNNIGLLDVVFGAWKQTRAERARQRGLKAASRRLGGENPMSRAIIPMVAEAVAAGLTCLRGAARGALASAQRKTSQAVNAIARVPGIYWGFAAFVFVVFSIALVLAVAFVSADDPLVAFDGAQNAPLSKEETAAWAKTPVNPSSPTMQVANFNSSGTNPQIPRPEILDACFARGQCVWLTVGEWDNARWIFTHRLPQGVAPHWTADQRRRLAQTGGFWDSASPLVTFMTFLGVLLLSLVPFVALGQAIARIHAAGSDGLLRMARWLALGTCATGFAALFSSVALAFFSIAAVISLAVGSVNTPRDSFTLCPTTWSADTHDARPESLGWTFSDSERCSASLAFLAEKFDTAPNAPVSADAWKAVPWQTTNPLRALAAVLVGSRLAHWLPVDGLPVRLQAVARQARDCDLLVFRVILLCLFSVPSICLFVVWTHRSAPFDAAEKKWLGKVEDWGVLGRRERERLALLAAANKGRRLALRTGGTEGVEAETYTGVAKGKSRRL